MLLSLLLATPLLAPAQQESIERTARSAEGVLHVEGQLLVAWEPGTPLSRRQASVESLGGTLGRRVGGRVLHLVHLSGDVTAESQQARFAELEDVRYAELNGIGSGLGSIGGPNDPQYGMQWHLENTAMNNGTPGADIDAATAWVRTTGDSSIVLAVLDSGIDDADPEFSGRLLPGIDTVNGDSIPNADHPHGINVTSLAAANTNNGVDVAGVDRQCTILPVKVLNQFNLGTVAWLVDGLDFVTQNNVDVVNMSLGNYPAAQPLIDALQDASDSGSILIAAAGNGGLGNADVSWPGASPLTISIGATTDRDSRATFSATGSRLDFVAPGEDTWTLGQFGPNFFSGTSAAAPIVAGVVTLLLSVDPTLTQDEVYELLTLGAEDQVGSPAFDLPGRDDRYGHGRVNASRTLDALDNPVRYCSAVANSTGVPGQIELVGSSVVADDDFRLAGTSLPPFATSMFIIGSERASIGQPGGSAGILCVGGNFGRVTASLQPADASGSIQHRLDLSVLPVIGGPPAVAGDRWRFQIWHRDVFVGVPVSNFSDAIDVPFL